VFREESIGHLRERAAELIEVDGGDRAHPGAVLFSTSAATAHRVNVCKKRNEISRKRFVPEALS
jgi:hypothetical protein